MDREGPWLTDEQQHVWRQWSRLNAALSAALHRELHTDSGLSLPDFHVLVQLSDTAGERVRVSTLANALGWERSRLSHHVRRMEGRGLVLREECPDDGRGAFVVLTSTGRAAFEAAAPAHARTVRALVFDGLTERDLEVVARFTERTLSRLHPEGPHVPTDPIDDASTAGGSGPAAGRR